jgi:ABC-2 type transport system ATP-binding protein
VPPVVALDRIAKAYETKIAVASLSLSIEAGTMFGLLGPNGAGKTSSIRMITGITLPDSGTVSLFGAPFTRAALRRVGYLPEERGLYKKMRVLDQLIFIGQLHGLDAATARRRSIEWCEKLRITEAIDASANKKTDELSKGMQQKIQFIATLLHEPELIIMDEPFSGLDPVNAILLEDTLLELKRAGRAILFSTHRMDQVEKLCDAICLVDQGRAVLEGSMREVKSRYERDKIRIQFTGSDAFLSHPSIASIKAYADSSEVRLVPGADPQELLQAAVECARITRFEVLEPSLEEIFIKTVGRPMASPAEAPAYA